MGDGRNHKYVPRVNIEYPCWRHHHRVILSPPVGKTVLKSRTEAYVKLALEADAEVGG